MTARRPALFLDRDGVLNVDCGFVARAEDFAWQPGAIAMVRAFNMRGWRVFVVTNQTGVAFGHYTLDDMARVHHRLESDLAAAGARIDRIYHCPYHPDATIATYRRDSFDRKPRPGMILNAFADFPLVKERSFLIGDKETDLLAARAAGIAGFLYRGGDLETFAEWALADLGEGGR